MTRLFRPSWLAAIALLALSGVASAGPINVDPATEGSSVNVAVGDGCNYCWISVALSEALNEGGQMMDIGDEWTFDFFDIVVGGIGANQMLIDATLAFVAPELLAASAQGSGGFFTLFGVISGGILQWDQPDLLALQDGTYLQISFENIRGVTLGNSTTVSATVKRLIAVPEPATLSLLGIGLMLLALMHPRRRRATSARSNTT